MNKNLRVNKNGKAAAFATLSRSVLRAGIEPARLLRSQDFKSCVSTKNACQSCGLRYVFVRGLTERYNHSCFHNNMQGLVISKCS